MFRPSKDLDLNVTNPTKFIYMYAMFARIFCIWFHDSISNRQYICSLLLQASFPHLTHLFSFPFQALLSPPWLSCRVILLKCKRRHNYQAGLLKDLLWFDVPVDNTFRKPSCIRLPAEGLLNVPAVDCFLVGKEELPGWSINSLLVHL